jgi:hypothetical protein
MRKPVRIGLVVFALTCLGLTFAGQYWAFGLIILVLGPIAFYNSFINPKTRTVSPRGPRPFIEGRDCRYCGGWGNINGAQCLICGGRRTR